MFPSLDQSQGSGPDCIGKGVPRPGPSLPMPGQLLTSPNHGPFRPELQAIKHGKERSTKSTIYFADLALSILTGSSRLQSLDSLTATTPPSGW